MLDDRRLNDRRLDDKSRSLAGLFRREPWSASDLLERAQGRDIGSGLRAIVGLRHELKIHEARLIRAARAKGWSWGQIALALRVTRQAAARKWAAASKG